MNQKPLFILLCSDEHEKIQMAGMIASVAAVSERPVTVFISMGAVPVFDSEAKAGARYKGGKFSDLMLEKDVPDAVQLFVQGKALGEMKMYACSMALDVLGWTVDNLTEGLFEGPMGLTRFLDEAEDGQIITF